MILMHIVYGLDLIALTMGTGLLVWAIKNPGKGSWLGKLFGVIVMVLSIISIACIYSCALRGGECHRPLMGGEGMMMGQPMPATGPVGHEHGMKKIEHKK